MTRPLTGRRIVVTRAEDQADALVATLRGLGAEPLLVPAIQSVPASDARALAEAAAGLAGARWVGVTSPAGVRHGWPAVARAWPDGLPAGVGVAAVGPGTAGALGAAGVAVDFVPSVSTGDAFAAELPLTRGDRVVLLRSDIARQAIARTLAERGARVLDATAYHTVEQADPADARQALDAQPDAVLFTSPSTVRGFLAGVDNLERLRAVCLVPIGPVTAEAVAAAGLRPAVVPDAFTVDGLLDALVRLFA